MQDGLYSTQGGMRFLRKDGQWFIAWNLERGPLPMDDRNMVDAFGRLTGLPGGEGTAKATVTVGELIDDLYGDAIRSDVDMTSYGESGLTKPPYAKIAKAFFKKHLESRKKEPTLPEMISLLTFRDYMNEAFEDSSLY